MSYELLLGAATIAGPILAVQAQKFVERSQARSRARDEVFRTLFATRDKRLSLEHVRALNTIDLAFRPSSFLGFTFPLRRLTVVQTAWQRYIDELATPPVDQSPASVGSSNRMRDERFYELLLAMSNYLGYQIDERVLRQRVYLPTGHVEMEDDARAFRKAIGEVVSGNRPLPIMLIGTPQPQQQQVPSLTSQGDDQQKIAHVPNEQGQ